MDRPCYTIDHDVFGRVYPQHQRWVPMAGAPTATMGSFSHRILATWSGPLPTALIEHNAKLGDLVASPLSYYGLLMAARMRAVFEQFALPEHRFLEVPMLHRNKPVEGYSFLHVMPPDLPISEEMTPAEVEAVIEAEPALASAHYLVLDQPPRYAHRFVSQPLKKALEAVKLNGVRFGTAKIFR